MENPNFVVSVMPGSVSNVFYWNFVVFVMPGMVFAICISEMLTGITKTIIFNQKTPENTARNYENNEFAISVPIVPAIAAIAAIAAITGIRAKMLQRSHL